jgi:hypothetical protein
MPFKSPTKKYLHGLGTIWSFTISVKIWISLLHNGAGEDDSHKLAALLTNLVTVILNKFLNNLFYIWTQMFIKACVFKYIYYLYMQCIINT